MQVLLVSLMALAIPASAQVTEPFNLTSPEVLNHNGALDLRFKDFDQDGDLDIVTFQPEKDEDDVDVKFFKNRLEVGRAIPTLFDQFAYSDILAGQLLNASGLPEHAFFDGVYDMYFVDVDSDGDDDWPVARLQARDLLFLNNATGSNPGKFDVKVDLYSPQGSDCAGVGDRYSTGMAIGDCDRDGDVDLVLCFRDSQTRLYTNNGFGTFTEAQRIELPPGQSPPAGSRDVALKDLDHDGDLDCAVARMMLNTACTDPLFRHVIIYQNVGPDPDRDGNPDPNTPFRFWYNLKPGCGEDDPAPNQGTGEFVGGSPSLTITIYDVNDDGYADLIQPLISAETNCSSCEPDVRPRIYLNDPVQRGILGAKDSVGLPTYRPSTWVGACSQGAYGA